jgi:hypothetical protein
MKYTGRHQIIRITLTPMPVYSSDPVASTLSFRQIRGRATTWGDNSPVSQAGAGGGWLLSDPMRIRRAWWVGIAWKVVRLPHDHCPRDSMLQFPPTSLTQADPPPPPPPKLAALVATPADENCARRTFELASTHSSARCVAGLPGCGRSNHSAPCIFCIENCQ